ncbi:hypothetical protein VPH35_090561 [Triticum aestivum]
MNSVPPQQPAGRRGGPCRALPPTDLQLGCSVNAVVVGRFWQSPVVTTEPYTTPSFPVYRSYLKILVFLFYNAQFGCFSSHVQILRCIKSLHASIKRKLINACNLCVHALQLMHW